MMDVRTRWIIVIILTLIISGGAYLYIKNAMFTKETPRQRIDTPASISIDKGPVSNIGGVYIVYSPESIINAKGDILLFFHAPWCPQCRAIEKTISNSSLPDNLTLFKVDYDSNQELRKKYDVTLQTTFVKIDKDGNKLASYVAYSEPTFEAVKRELLP